MKGNIKHISLKMSKQARTELFSAWRAKYASATSRYKKAMIIAAIIQSADYRSCKTAIRLLSSKKAPPGKKKGRRRIIGCKELQVIKKIEFVVGQPWVIRAQVLTIFSAEQLRAISVKNEAWYFQPNSYAITDCLRKSDDSPQSPVLSADKMNRQPIGASEIIFSEDGVARTIGEDAPFLHNKSMGELRQYIFDALRNKDESKLRKLLGEPGDGTQQVFSSRNIKKYAGFI